MPATVSNWTTEVFNDQVIEVTSAFWGVMNVKASDPDKGYVVGQITVKNNLSIPIQNVIVKVDVDDLSPTWDAALVDSNENRYWPPKVFNIGTIGPGVTTTSLSYWWEPLYNGPPVGEDWDVTFDIIPSYVIDYGGHRVFDSSKCHVNVSD